MTIVLLYPCLSTAAPLRPPAPAECRLEMNERPDSVERRMGLLNVPLRNAPLCCGVFWLQLRLESCVVGLVWSAGPLGVQLHPINPIEV